MLTVSLKTRQKIAGTVRKFSQLSNLATLIIRVFQARYSVGVVGVLVNPENKILLVEHVFHAVNPWGLPGGWMGNREHPEEALQRELQEELGIEVIIKSILAISNKFRGNHIDIAYLCKTEGTVNHLSSELLGYQWVSLDNLPADMHEFHKLALETFRLQHLDRS